MGESLGQFTAQGLELLRVQGSRIEDGLGQYSYLI